MSAFRIDGPALISFSGGRTSAYMLHEIVEAHGGTLPDDVRVTFANTGREMPETLDFVRECGEQFGVDITWLEYRPHDEARKRWHQVTYETASRDGEPFKALIRERQYLPNPVTRFCTVALKIDAMQGFARSLGWDHWSNVIGLRADEPSRVAKSRDSKRVYDNVMPLADAGVTKFHVSVFWAARNFDLALPSIKSKTALGNCDLCFLKSAATISGIMRVAPSLAKWWIEAEAETLASKPLGARFRKDRPSYASMFKSVQDNGPGFDFGAADELNDCYCTGDA